MNTRYHMCQSVRGALRNWSGRQWSDATEWISRKDGSKISSGEELEFIFQQLLDAGNEVIPIGDECDNFDPKKGCLGHPIPTEPTITVHHANGKPRVLTKADYDALCASGMMWEFHPDAPARWPF